MPETPYADYEHINDPVRIQLARTVLAKEHRKLYVGVPEESWAAIDDSVQGWAEDPAAYHLEHTEDTADFWDAFAAHMGQIKHKPGFTSWITAQNVNWSHSSVPVRTIHMTHPLEQLEHIPGLTARRNMSFAAVVEALATDDDARTEQARLIATHSTDPQQDAYPVIIREVDGTRQVMDGNRRVLKAAIDNRPEIDAWVGVLDGPRPVNFWVPLGTMLELVRVFDEASVAQNTTLQRATSFVLQSYFHDSPVAQEAYSRHILGHTTAARNLFAMSAEAPSVPARQSAPE